MNALSNSKINSACLMILAAFAVVVGLIYTKAVFVPFVFSIFLYLILHPLFEFLQVKWKFPKPLALITTFIVLGLSLAVIFFLVFTSVNSFARGANVYQDRINAMTSEAVLFAAELGIDLDDINLIETMRSLPIVSYLKSASSSLVGFLGNLALVGFFCLFLLAGESSIKKKPPFLDEILNRISVYVSTKLVVSTVTGILVGIVLFAFDVELAFMFALLVFLLNFIPSIGSVIATIVPIPIILLQFGFGGQFISVLVLTAAIQVTIGNIIEPKIMGEAMDLHPVVILMSLIFWGLVWGVAGMFLAVPITSICKIIFSRIESTRSASELMAGRF